MRIFIGSLVAAAVIFAGPSLPTQSVEASDELAQQLELSCVACHDKPGSKLLTDQGKYFELMRSMDGYEEIIASFQECTACHARKPGSTKLTRRGRQVARVLRDMEELRAWVLAAHPEGGEEEKSTPPPAQSPPDESPERDEESGSDEAADG